MPKFGTKNALFGYFWTRCLKSYCHTWNKHPWVCLIDKFRQKTKCLSCGLKMPYLGILWVEFEKLIVTFGISTLGFVWLENFTKKQKRLNLGPKMTKFVTKNALFGCFGAGIWKQYWHFLNQHHHIWLIPLFREIMKIPKFGTKNASCVYYRLEFLKICCHIWYQQPQICVIAKFHEKTKIPKLGIKNALFGYFWAGIWKQYCHILNQYSRICLTANFRAIMKIPKFCLLSYLKSAP